MLEDVHVRAGSALRVTTGPGTKLVVRGLVVDNAGGSLVALTDAEARTNALTEAEEAARAAEPYGFICECFFLTARAMHLGYVKCAAEHTALAREVQDRARQMEDVDQMRDSWAASIPGGPSQFQMSQFERRVAEMKGELERAKANYAMFDAALLDPETLGESARFYRLVAVSYTHLTLPPILLV